MKKASFAKKSLSAVLTLAMLIGILAMLPITVSAAATPLATAEDPILIGSTSDLDTLSSKITAAEAARSAETKTDTYYVEFTAEIDYNGAKITHASFGNYSVHVDGKGHSVSNFTGDHGIFYILGTNSTVKNLHAVNFTANKTSAQMGAIVGYVKGGFTMINCSASGSITNTRTSSAPAVGGLVGSFEAGVYDHYIANCVNYVNVTASGHASSWAGGIVGKAYAPHANITIENCENYGTINGKKQTGGILGGIENAVELTLNDCTNEGDVTGTDYVGGLVGYAKVANSSSWAAYAVNRNLNLGNVTGSQYVAGIIAYVTGNSSFRMNYCGNEGILTNTAQGGYTAGIMAYVNQTHLPDSRNWISNCYTTGKIVAEPGYSGGIIGEFNSTVAGNALTITECYDAATREVGDGDHYLLIYTSNNCSNSTNKTLYYTRSHALESGSVTAFGQTPDQIESSSVVSSMTDMVPVDYSGSKTETFEHALANRQAWARARKADGTGTQNDPFIIDDLAGMIWLSLAYTGFDRMTYVELTADIDYEGRAISMDFAGDRSIYFDGNNHTLSNYISCYGLFARLGPDSTIKDLRVAGAKIDNDDSYCIRSSGSYDANRHIGAIVGLAYSGLTMTGCSTDSTTDVKNTTSGYAAGGLVGSVETSGNSFFFMNCSNAAKVVGQQEVGGIVGKLSTTDATTDLAIMNCTNSGQIISQSSSAYGAGGILGYAFRGDVIDIYNCENTGNVTATSAAHAGGIVGSTEANSSSPITLNVQNCRNTGTITAYGDAYAAGIVGYGRVATGTPRTWTIASCANEGTVTATNKGGILGTVSEKVTMNISTCYTTVGNAVAVAPANGTTANCYSAGATVPADVQRAVNARINATGNLSIRLKLTDGFGLMAITEIEMGGEKQALSNYAEVGFYFLESDDTVLPADLIKNENKYETPITDGKCYNGSTTRFYGAYTDLHVANLDRNLHFMAYAKDANGNVVYSSIRTMDVRALVEDISDGYMGKNLVVTDEFELALYQKMLAYGDAYESYENIDISIGTFNIAQDNFKKTESDDIDSSVSNIQANLDLYADTMYDLGLDIMGLNEVNIYRGSSTSYGGYNVPWEIAQRMEDKTGDKYYWAFATAIDSSALNAEGDPLRPFYNAYASVTDASQKPDGRWYSGDGDLSAPTTAGYGEGIVSKYPIVSYEAKYIVPADYAGDNGTYQQYTKDYQYDLSNKYERRVILVVQLDLDGDLNNGKSELITVMVSHWDHTGDAIPMTAAVGAVKDVLADPKYAGTPMFLMGDLNTQTHASYIPQIDAVMNRAGKGDMTSTHSNGSKIDHIFADDYTEILSYGVDSKNVASDHSPVYITARVKRTDFR